MSFHPKILTLLYMMEKMLTKTNTHSVILTWSHEKFSIINETSPKKDNWSGLITYELVAYRKKPINRDYACKRKHVLKYIFFQKSCRKWSRKTSSRPNFIAWSPLLLDILVEIVYWNCFLTRLWRQKIWN